MERSIQKVSIVLLTYNRLEYVRQSVENNLAKAGYPIFEVIWVDNNSTDGTIGYMQGLGLDKEILNNENTGVARGYNAGYKIAKGDIIVKPGTDMVLPQDWLKKLVEGLETGRRAGVVGIVWNDTNIPERKLGEVEGNLIKAKVVGIQAIKKEVFEVAGYLPENHGLYGWDDVEWDINVRKYFYTYYLTDVMAEHLTYLDNTEYKEYSDFKDSGEQWI